LFRFLGLLNADTVKITYVEADGSSKTVDAEIGQNLMDVAHANDIELEGTYLHCTVRFDELCEECQIMCGISRVWLGLVWFLSSSMEKESRNTYTIYSSLLGACGGELACSTCHLIFEQSVYDTLPEKEEEEDDMLDLAMEVTET
jgi:ferredoxin